jgi:hypothetical protein
MNYLRKKIIQYLVKNLLVAVEEGDILTITNKGWFVHKRKLSEEEVIQLKEEAESLHHSVIWNMMANEIRFLANDRMFEKSAEEGNSVFGRAMLYNLQLLEKFINNCRKL